MEDGNGEGRREQQQKEEQQQQQQQRMAKKSKHQRNRSASGSAFEVKGSKSMLFGDDEGDERQDAHRGTVGKGVFDVGVQEGVNTVNEEEEGDGSEEHVARQWPPGITAGAQNAELLRRMRSNSAGIRGGRARMLNKHSSSPAEPLLNVNMGSSFRMPDLRMRSPSFRAGIMRRRSTAQHAGGDLSPPGTPGTPGTTEIPRISSADDRAGWESGYGTASSPLLGSASVLPVVHGKSQMGLQKVIESLIYGLVNSILTVPCMYGYTAIIFRDTTFQPHMADLAKLVLFSSVVHQCVFSLESSLSFSIGQVQDAGLIFLSTMASTIASETNGNANMALPTTLVTLSLATAMLGAVVYLIGRLRLAKLVSYLPMPVVGGYLAFIGFFCFEAGVGLSIGQDVSIVTDLAKVFHPDAMRLVLPALVAGVLLAVVAKKARSWYSLPLCILALPTAFYAVLFATNTSIAEAQEAGWMSKPQGEPSGPFWDVWTMFDFRLVQWDLVPKQALTWISMVFVVSFSSCLDVVAIEMDMGRELDINHELCTVGLSNVISGLTGGYTGSYIFSQTIFTFRTGTDSRLVGGVVIFSELALFFSPFNVMEYVPLYFFAATLIFIAFDLLNEWLVAVRSKVSVKEYGVLLATFLSITLTNDLMMGILLGIVLSILNFIVAYASVTHIQRTYKTKSNVVRDFERRKVLKRMHGQIARLDLHGFIFFGSSVQIVKKLQILLEEHDNDEASRTTAGANLDGNSSDVGPSTTPLSWWSSAWEKFQRAVGSTPGPGTEAATRRSFSQQPSVEATLPVAKPPGMIPRQVSAQTLFSDSVEARGIRFLILDFTRVTGIDSSAISAGLMRVKQLAVLHDMTVVFTSIREEFVDLLVANELIVPDDPEDPCKVFKEINDGLEWAENQILMDCGMFTRDSARQSMLGVTSPGTASDGVQTSEASLVAEAQPTMPDIPFAFNHDGTRNKVIMSLHYVPQSMKWLRRILTDFFGFHSSFDLSLDDPDLGEYTDLTEYFGLMRLREGDYVFRAGDPADALYIVMVGEVSLYVPSSQVKHLLNKHDRFWREQYDTPKEKLLEGGKLLQRARFGCIFGEIHFALGEPRQFSAVATEECAIFFLSRTRFQELEARDPKLAVGIYQCLNKFLALTVSDMQSYKYYAA